MTLGALALAALSAGGCKRGGAPKGDERANGQSSTPAPTPAVTIVGGAQPVLFHVEIAATPEERANGLVGRPSLASDAGLLFVFEQAGVQTLRMTDTLIPLDMIFIGPDRRIVGLVHDARPLTDTAYRVAAPARYVLQIRGGLASQLGFRAGQAVTFRAVPGA